MRAGQARNKTARRARRASASDSELGELGAREFGKPKRTWKGWGGLCRS